MKQLPLYSWYTSFFNITFFKMYNWCVSPDNDTLLSPVLSICFFLHSFYFALIFRSSADAFTATVKCTPMAPNTGLLSNNNDSDLLEISGICPTSRRLRHSPQYTCGASVYLSLYPEQADGVSHTRTTHTLTRHHAKTLSTFLPLRKQGELAFSPPALDVLPCH